MFLKFLSTSLIIFSKYYHYTFLTLFILINIIFFSEEIGLGVKEEFILFKTIGVFRSSIFFALIFITLSLLALLILLKMLFMQKHDGISNKNILGKAFKIYFFLTL